MKYYICSNLEPQPRSDFDSQKIDIIVLNLKLEWTKLHQKWYKLNTKTGKYEKFVPLNISELLTPISSPLVNGLLRKSS